MLLQRSQTSAGITPIRINNANALQPRQSPNTDSSSAATIRPPKTNLAAVIDPPSARTLAEPVKTRPMPCAKRFGGPAVSFGSISSRGLTMRVTNSASGLKFGPLITRRRNPTVSRSISAVDPVTNAKTASRKTPPAVMRAETSSTGLGKASFATPQD